MPSLSLTKINLNCFIQKSVSAVMQVFVHNFWSGLILEKERCCKICNKQTNDKFGQFTRNYFPWNWKGSVCSYISTKCLKKSALENYKTCNEHCSSWMCRKNINFIVITIGLKIFKALILSTMIIRPTFCLPQIKFYLQDRRLFLFWLTTTYTFTRPYWFRFPPHYQGSTCFCECEKCNFRKITPSHILN